MKKHASLLLCFTIVGVLTSCSEPPRPAPDPSSQVVSIQPQTLTSPGSDENLLTLPATAYVTLETRQASPTGDVQEPQLVPEPMAQMVQATWTLTPPRARTPIAQMATRPMQTAVLQAPVMPCLLAQPGRPIDLTVPDETVFHPGQYFSKTWRLINAGVCPWTRDFAVVWFSGDDLGINRVQPFGGSVLPGQSMDITLDMNAPLSPGTYQSNWKLRDQQGELFGIGPGGRSPFWVRIIVVAEETPTETPEIPGDTPTPTVLASAALSLTENSAIDLDSAQLDQGTQDDVLFQIGDTPQLAPVNGTRLVSFGVLEPSQADCVLAALSSEPLVLDTLVAPGSYLCYQTSAGFYGQLLLKAIDLENHRVDLEFVTWTAR